MGWKSVDWIELAQGRDKWRTPVNAVMGKIFVTSWGTVRFSRRTQLLGFSGIEAPGMVCVWWNVGVHCYTDRCHVVCTRWCYTQRCRIRNEGQSPAVNLLGQKTVFVYDSLVSQIGVISGAAFVRSTPSPSGEQFSVCTVRFPSILTYRVFLLVCCVHALAPPTCSVYPGHLILLALRPVPNVALLPMLSVYLISHRIMCRGNL